MKRAAELNSLREEMRQVLASLTADERLQASHSLCSLLKASFSKRPFSKERWLGFYRPFSTEVDLSLWIRELSQEGWQICFPKVISATEMVFVEAHLDRPESWCQGKWGMLEPVSAVPVSPDLIQGIWIPGLAFSSGLQRVGRGKGFYDRWLAHYRGWKVGVGFDQQIVDKIPYQSWDVPMDEVVTPSCRYQQQSAD